MTMAAHAPYFTDHQPISEPLQTSASIIMAKSEASAGDMTRVETCDSGQMVGDPPTRTEAEAEADPPVLEKKVVKAEIDTSAPFDSVKEAVTRFGGIGFWKPVSQKNPFPQNSEHDIDVIDIAEVEAQTAQLEKDLILKERETFEVLKELESTKMTVEKLKERIQREASEVDVALSPHSDDLNLKQDLKVEEKEIQENITTSLPHSAGSLELCPSTPGFILQELKQAKLNLTRTTTDLADIRATVESYNKKIEKERNSLEKTRQRLSSSSGKISSLEEELSKTKQKLQLIKEAEVQGGFDCTMDISRELQRLSSETEQFKQIGEIARSEVLRAISEIELTKSKIKTAEMRLVAARKMKDAARATEAVALAEINALSKSGNFLEAGKEEHEGVTISFKEYSSLTSRALRAKELCKKKEMDAMLLVDEANVSKMDILKKVEEVKEEVMTSKEVLEEALGRVEAANRGKLAVEEALRKWRSEHGQKRRSVQNSTKFKNSLYRKDSRALDVNLMIDDSKPVLKPTLSIGQILSRKLLLTEEFESGLQSGNSSVGKRKVSLAQMLRKKNGDDTHLAQKSEEKSDQKRLPAKRKKFGFGRISLLVTKQSKKKKRQSASSRVTVCRSVDID